MIKDSISTKHAHCDRWISELSRQIQKIHQRNQFNYSVFVQCTSYSIDFWFNFVIYTIWLRIFFFNYGTSCSNIAHLLKNNHFTQSKLRLTHFFLCFFFLFGLILSNYCAQWGLNHSGHHEFHLYPFVLLWSESKGIEYLILLARY